MDTKIVLDKLKEYKEKNRSKFLIKDLGIFGSVARGEDTRNSDLDVIVNLENPDLFALVHIKEEIEKEIGCSVDLIRYRSHMNKYLKEQIDKEAVFV